MTEIVAPERVERGPVERLRAHGLPAAVLELDEEGLLDVELATVRPLTDGAVDGDEMVVVRDRPESSTR